MAEMSDTVAGRSRAAARDRLDAAGASAAGLDVRRALQLGLAAIWLLDGVLQFQSFMFTKAFGQMIGATSSDNPVIVSHAINWNAALVEHHLVLLNAIFATVQLLLGLGIAYRPTVRLALAASIVWALGVNGAPGAVIIYALLAVLLWPSDRPSGAPAPFVAARAVGAQVARALWLVLWGSLAYFALTPANRAPQALHDMIAGMASGEPGWLAALDKHSAALVAHQGLAASIVLAVALAIVAVGAYLPAPVAKATLVLAIVLAAVIWVVGEGFGTILTGGGTDPNSGPLLALLALTYWPLAAAATPRADRSVADERPEGITA
jgi:hypothetical protein